MTKPSVISLYSGAGGIDYGLEAAGFDTAVALEMDHDCCETLRNSRPRWRVIERSISDVPTSEILSDGGLKKGDVDLLVGGPPCQPFSKAGYWSRGDSLRLDDPRAHTLSAYMRVVEETLPRVFLLENVEGLAYATKDEGMRLLFDQINDINRKKGTCYRPTFRVLNAADYGAPQRRERVFLIAAREGTPFQFPSPTHRDREEEPTLLTSSLPTHRTTWDALADVGPEPGETVAPQGKWADLLKSIPEGQNYLFHTDRGGGKPLFGWRRRYWSFLLKLAKNRPSWTLQAQPGPAIGPFHWESRRLGVRELSRLMTFPDGIQFAGGRGSVQKQLGNAVVSLMAEVLAREIRTQLLGLRRVSGPLKLMPPDRGLPPPPEKVSIVPRRFLALQGDHDAHPGTGKGHRASRRELASEDLAGQLQRSIEFQHTLPD